MNVSGKLKELRTSKGMSMGELSEIFMSLYGVTLSKSMISRYENGLTEPSLSIACLYAQYFNVTLDFLTKDDELDILAAHYDGEEFNQDELDEIEKFKEFVKARRKEKTDHK